MGNTPSDPPESHADKFAWARQAVTYRLTAKRKRDLQVLAGDPSASPTEALDLAIELAVDSRATTAGPERGDQPLNAEISVALDGLRLQTDALAGAIEHWGESRAQLARVAAECAELRRSLAHAAGLSGDGGCKDADSSVTVREWLDEAVDLATPWVVAKIRWIAKRPAGPGMATWEVELRELSRSGSAVARRVHADRVSLGPDLINGPLARMESEGAVVLSCARSGLDWTLSLRPALENGKLGAPFAEFRV
jgi:hypothetical protein